MSPFGSYLWGKGPHIEDHLLQWLFLETHGTRFSSKGNLRRGGFPQPIPSPLGSTKTFRTSVGFPRFASCAFSHVQVRHDWSPREGHGAKRCTAAWPPNPDSDATSQNASSAARSEREFGTRTGQHQCPLGRGVYSYGRESRQRAFAVSNINKLTNFVVYGWVRIYYLEI